MSVNTGQNIAPHLRMHMGKFSTLALSRALLPRGDAEPVHAHRRLCVRACVSARARVCVCVCVCVCVLCIYIRNLLLDLGDFINFFDGHFRDYFLPWLVGS